MNLLPTEPHVLRPWMYTVLALVTGAVLGYWKGTGTQTLVTTDRNIVTQGETRVIDHIVTVTKTVQPDGTVTETTKTEDQQEDQHTTTVETDKSSTTIPNLAKYSLALQYGIQYSNILGDISRPDPEQVQVVAGYRVLGPLWIEAGGSLKQVNLGVRFEF